MSENPTPPIVMYSTLWCPDCRRAKKFLTERGVEFREVFIENNPEAEDLVIRVNRGKRRVPTIQVGDRYFAASPFNAAQIAKELNIPIN
jgi:glutaredoxin